MSIQTRQITLGLALIAVVSAHAARADSYDREYDGYGDRPTVWSDPRIVSGIGIGIHAGGGIGGFTDPRLRETTAPIGGTWNLRAAIGTHVPLALELGYMGSATAIEAEFGRADALMLGTTVEAALRYNVLPLNVWSPYVFAGAGWQRFTIDDRAFQLSDTGIGNRDDLLVLPIGTGLAYRYGAFVTDVRGTFRYARGEGLVLETPLDAVEDGFGIYAPMHQWDASLNVGYEF